jgi:hypothetical protein
MPTPFSWGGVPPGGMTVRSRSLAQRTRERRLERSFPHLSLGSFARFSMGVPIPAIGRPWWVRSRRSRGWTARLGSFGAFRAGRVRLRIPPRPLSLLACALRTPPGRPGALRDYRKSERCASSRSREFHAVCSSSGTTIDRPRREAVNRSTMEVPGDVSHGGHNLTNPLNMFFGAAGTIVVRISQNSDRRNHRD